MWPGNVSDINIEINCYCISSQALEMTLKRIILFDKQIRPWFSIGAVNRWKWFCCFLLGQLRCIGIHLFLRLKNIWSINKHEQQYNSRWKNDALVYFEGNNTFNDNHVAILKPNKKICMKNDFEYFDRSTIYR